MKKHKRQSMRTQIFIYFLLSTGVVLLVMGSLLYFNFSNLMEEEILKSTEMGIDKSGKQLELYINRVKDMSSILAGNVNTCSYFEHDHEGHEPDKDDKTDIDSLIETILSSNKEIQTVIMVGYDGKLISNVPDLGMEMSEDMMEQQWYTDALKNDMPVLTSARMQDFTMDKDTWVLSLSREISGDCDENIGVLFIDFKYDVIESILSELDLGSKGYAFILNEKDEVVYHEDTRYFEDDEKRNELIAVAGRSNEQKDEELLTHSYKVKGTDWTLVGVASLDGVKSMRQDMVLILWMLGSALLIIALGSSAIFSRRMAAPLRKLEKAMAEVETGKLDGQVEIGGSAEAESLANHYTNMMKRIRSLLEEIQLKEKYLRTSELNVLQSQINPHFLYNTLDTILWAAEFQDSKKVISLTKALARFFRLSLGDGGRMTTVGDEIDHVRQYLFIQKERYQDKLRYTISADEEILKKRIPKLILQPIVENAIYHGIRNMEKQGMIEIKAKKQEDYIIFTISDNGVGYDIESEKTGGVGQSNVDKRIKLYYGGEYGVSIESKQGKGTTVTLKLGKKLI